ncbi:MAG: FAD-binding oxidoreductase, partial [Desulfobacterales bacterium]|nr:FAD-binding oxidoreductase [Desulfobacterales bacterium]
LGVKTLVLDRHSSPGQGENKHAIGGVRATHSDPAKIVMCLRSLEIYATWREIHGDDIEWLRGGYLFPVYREKEEAALKGIMPIQKKFGLDIDFVGPERVAELTPGISTEDLIGGAFSPNDGSISPMMAVNAFYRKAVENGVRFEFKKEIEKIIVEGDKATGVVAGGETFHAPVVVDAAGPFSRQLSRMAGSDVAVTPDSHEGAITEPVKPFFKCMVVDLRPGPGSNNYYFYQNRFGQVIFCLTPDPPIIGTDTRETSTFLPMVCARMVKLVPRLRNIRVRRMWRGLYPMTPDGF